MNFKQIKDDAQGLHIDEDNKGTGFFGVAPVTQPASADQAALTDSTGGGVADATLAALGDTSTIDGSAAINDNFAKVAELVNALRLAVVDLGLAKGSA